jgi:hypothetical protein
MNPQPFRIKILPHKVHPKSYVMKILRKKR